MNETFYTANEHAGHPLIGRDRELRILADSFATAVSGQGGLVLITGEAGIGKTSLAEAVYRTTPGAVILTGHSYELTDTPPYGPWVDLFSRYHPADDDPQPPNAFAEPGNVGEIPSTARLFQEVRDFFASLTKSRTTDARPIVVLLEDLHWSDPASLDLLRFLGREVAGLPVLLIGTYRSDEVTPTHPLGRLLPAMTRESRATIVDLRRLLLTDIQLLLSGRYALAQGDHARLVEYLYRRSEGNPFFAMELLRTLEEGRVLRQDGETWNVGDLTRVPVPTLARQVIEARLDRLDADRRRQLAVAAVIGQEIQVTLWTAVSGEDRSALQATVERGVTGHLLVESDDGTRLRFAHALIRETLYEQTPLPMRQAWHRRIAGALLSSPNPDPDDVANHFLRAADERAVDWLVRAGDRAQRAYAWETAINRYQTALDLMEETSADPGQRAWLLCLLGLLHRYSDPWCGVEYMERAAILATQSGDPVITAITLYYRGYLHTYAGNGMQGIDYQRAGIAMIDAFSPTERDQFRAMTANGRMAREWNPWASFCVGLVLFGHYRESERLVQRLLAEEHQEDGLTEKQNAASYRALMEIHSAFGRPDEACQAGAHARSGFEAMDHQAMLGGTAMVELTSTVLPYFTNQIAERQSIADMTERAWSLAGASVTDPDFSPRSGCFSLFMLRGEWEEASRIASVMLRLDWFVDAFTGEIARLAYWRGDQNLARQIIGKSMTSGPPTPPGQLHYRTGLELQRISVQIAIDDGDLETAKTWLEAHDRWLDWSETVLGRAEGHLAWAGWHRACGNLETGLERAREALDAASNPRQPLALIGAYRMLGEVETELGRFGSARIHLGSSLALADACAAPYERARSLVALGQFAVVRGDRNTAQQHLTQARTICTHLGAALLLARIHAIDPRLAEGRGESLSGGITDREIEVLRLAAQGLDNARIAEQLYISAHTVHRHMANIFTKLDVPSRTAAVAWALRHDLL
ncbi:hypothetical protein BH23CHL2_BH23CHL2_04740 [soil metagenome]